MKTEFNTSKAKKINFIFSESKSLMSECKYEKNRVIFTFFLIPIITLGIFYIINSATAIIYFYHLRASSINKAAIGILKILVCFFITTPIVSDILITCHRISKNENIACGVEYYKSLYFFFGVILRTISTAVFLLLFLFSNYISYETASYFCIDDRVIFPGFAVLSIVLFVISLYRLTSFSFVFHLFITDDELSPRNARKISRQILNGHFCEALMLSARFIPCIFLSVSTFGLLFIYFIPRYLVTKSLFFRYIYAERSIYLKKYNSSYFKRTMEVKANEI